MKKTPISQTPTPQTQIAKLETTGEVVNAVEAALESVGLSSMVSSAELRDSLRRKLGGHIDYLAAAFHGHNNGQIHVVSAGVNYSLRFVKARIVDIERL